VIRELTSECVHCGFCLPTCPTYLLWSEEMDSPRGRIHLMDARLDGAVELNRTVVEHFDRCLGCMACVTACPSGVQYDRLLEATRDTIQREFGRSAGERLQRALLFSVLPYPRRLRLALAVAPLGRRLPLPGRLRPLVEIAPPWRSAEPVPALTPAAGEARGRVAMLTGCVQSVVFGDVNAATARVLAAEGLEVAAPPQGCCGALSAHSGRLDEAHAFTRGLHESLAGIETLVVNAAGCGSHLKEADGGPEVQDAAELLASLPPRAALHPLELSVAYQDSCHLRHAQRLPAVWRPLLERIPGLTIVEPAEQDVCCGSAGIYNVVQARAARDLGDRKAAHVLATGADACASANPGCLVQVAASLRRAGRPLPSLHPVELLDASIRGVPATELLTGARR
jgi:glycolate oxidase iron-sulfur subunit